MTKSLVARVTYAQMMSKHGTAAGRKTEHAKTWLQNEVTDFVKMCHGEDGAKDFQDHEISIITHVVQGTHFRNGDISDTYVDEKEFVHAMTEGQQMNHLWRMFDPDRRRPILQRIFDGNLA